jgi:hypothetical protein
LDRAWVSDGREIKSKSLAPSEGDKWTRIKLPRDLNAFQDFEVLSDKEILICGAMFTGSDPSSTRFDIHVIVNYQTGAITKVIESFDPAFVAKVVKNPRAAFYDVIKATRSYIVRFNSKILIVGSFSGFVTILDADTKNTRKIEIVPKEELPGDPERVINYTPVIPWVSPLPGDEVLLCCRYWAPPAEDEKEKEKEKEKVKELFNSSGTIYVFRTLNLRTGKATLHGHEYFEQEADSFSTLIEKDGWLTPVKKVIKHDFDPRKF